MEPNNQTEVKMVTFCRKALSAYLRSESFRTAHQYCDVISGDRRVVLSVTYMKPEEVTSGFFLHMIVLIIVDQTSIQVTE